MSLCAASFFLLGGFSFFSKKEKPHLKTKKFYLYQK